MSKSAARAAFDRLASGDTPVVVNPLGFACLRIRRGLCVHVWLPGEPELEPNSVTSAIRCHRWILDSRVLAGSVSSAVVDTRPCGMLAADFRVYEVRACPDGDVIRPAGFVWSTYARPERVGVGGSYRLPAGVFHETVVDVPTVVLSSAVWVPGVRDRVLGSLMAPTTRVYPRRSASVGLAERVTEYALRHLKEHV